MTDFQDSFLVVEEGQAAENNLRKQYGNSHHLLTKTMLVSSLKTSAISPETTYIATPRVAASTATFQCCYCSTVSPPVCPIALETTVSSSVPNSRLFSFSDS